jgi:hypothetical protein
MAADVNGQPWENGAEPAKSGSSQRRTGTGLDARVREARQRLTTGQNAARDPIERDYASERGYDRRPNVRSR